MQIKLKCFINLTKQTKKELLLNKKKEKTNKN